MKTWILTDERKGTENNAVGLAERLGLAYELRVVMLRQPWKSLSPWLRWGLKWAVRPRLAGPWPDLVISAGRTPAVAALAVKQHNPRTLLVHITNPGISPRHFDLVIAPAHDRLQGSNVVTTSGALHRVSPDYLAQGKAEWEPRWAHLPRPWHGLLIGGSTHGLKMTPELVLNWLDGIEKFGGTMLTATSRRTDKAVMDIFNLWRQRLEPPRNCWLGEGPNPYPGILACADDLFVTSDSVNMLSEAVATGRPVYVLPLAETGPSKFAAFLAALKAGGQVRDFALPLPAFTPKPLKDMENAAAAVKALIQARLGLSLSDGYEKH